MTWDTNVLREARQAVADIITTELPDVSVVTEWTGREHSGQVIIDGQGWKPLTGGVMVYDVRVTTIYAGTNAEVTCEDLSWQVYLALTNSDQAVTTPIPEGCGPVGIITQGSGESTRTYAATQMTVQIQVTLTE